ncbi:MAG: HEAT repeat domain-containing protein [Acidobacteria bacterium]|nr:HEAT repeat domain-containing protein [Acidobacteriota bacterium]
MAMAAVVLLAGTAPAQESLSTRLIRAEDARVLSLETHALLAEGMKSADPTVRAQAVRAAGRFETPSLLNDIMPRLTDPDAEVRRWASIATASSARLFTMPAIDELIRVMEPAKPADWGLYAAALGRIAMASPDQYRRVEQVLITPLPAPVSSTQAVIGRGPAAATLDVNQVEGAARGLESLTRISGKVAPLGDSARSRLYFLVESPAPAGSRAFARSRRLALLALRNARAIDGGLARTASRDMDDEVRRLAVATAAAAETADAPSTISDTDRDAVLAAGLKDAEPRVRYEALRGWGRYRQARDCRPVLGALTDASMHVAMAAIDLLAGDCGNATKVSPLLQREAEALPPSGATWHRAAHALVSLAKAAPADVRTLLPRFVGHPTWQVRMYAARAAGATGAVEALVQLGGDAHDNVREAALGELARLKRPEALAAAYVGLTRPDHQLVMTAARTLAGAVDRAKAAKALSIALLRLTLEGKDPSRDPRVAILTTLAEIGSTSDVDTVTPFLSDWDPRVAESAARAITKWTGQAKEAMPRPRSLAAPDLAALETARTKDLRITMARGEVMELRLLADEAPATVARVASLAAKGYYAGLTFHRVEPTFVIQGGSPGANEFMGDGPYMRDEPGVAHNRGTVGISTRGRDTGDAQIFVNLVDSPRLDHAYTVFAVVERGMDVADAVLEGDVMAKVELVDAPRR